MPHEWKIDETIRRSDGKIPYTCWKCLCMIARGPHEGAPDPDEVFWRGVKSEVDTCEDMQVLHVMLS